MQKRIFSLSGCAKLRHLNELLTLKDYSEEQASIDGQVKLQDEKFDRLLEAVRSGKIDAYKEEKEILDNFGEPVLKREEKGEEEILSEWLYRYQVKYFDTDKVYLYFDNNGILKDWKVIEGRKE